MKLKSLIVGGALVALVGGGVSWAATPDSASATTGYPTRVCNTKWYVNPDEGALKPHQQTTQGLVFDGPSLIHFHANVTLGHAANYSAYFSAHVVHGAAPLLKLETSPYSTINKGAGGWWSTKIASGPGSQNSPVAHLGDLIGKWNYTASTTIVSYGVGYANDQGNKAIVSFVRFGPYAQSLKCVVRPSHPKPPYSHTPKPPVTHSPTPRTSAPLPSTSTAPGEAPAPTPVKSDLPVTG